MAEKTESSGARSGNVPETVPRGPGTTSSPGPRRKLVLHIDLNNTILASDEASDMDTVACLDLFLSTVTWGKVDKRGEWKWLSDKPSLLPPCEGTVRYSSEFRHRDFTSAGGKCFRKILDKHLKLLRWPKGVKEDRDLSIEASDGHRYHFILPSFFQLLRDLVQEGREFAVLFRTFGHDLPRTLRAVSRALNEGAHPLFPDLPDLKLNVYMTEGWIRCSKTAVVAKRGEERVSTAEGERGLYQFFSSAQGVGGWVDDYGWWHRNSYSIRGGKPLYVDTFDPNVHHIFIDDNIRLNDEETAIHPMVFLDPVGNKTRTAPTSELYDMALIQNDLLQAISDPSYFTRRVHICVENYDRRLQQVAS